MKKLILGVCFSLSVCLTQVPTALQVHATSEASQEDENSFEYYEGEVTSSVNVRVGAGTSNKKLTLDGKAVVLKKGNIVTIIDTENVGKKPWYKIKFTYKDQELIGFSTSSYIIKTGNVITPTPLPEPTKAPTPVPTITVAPTKVPDSVLSPIPEQEDDREDSKSLKSKATIIILGIGIVGGSFALYFFTKRSKKDAQNSKQISEKVAKLKDMVIGSDEGQNRQIKQERNHTDIKRKPEVRVCKGDKIIQRTDLIHDSNEVYVKKSAEDEVAITLDFDEEEMIHDNADKKALRLAVEQLQEHDIVIHKFFGKGEVFDNSDVKLIEVRFGGDVRFLNKNQLVNKRLIEITNERKR